MTPTADAPAPGPDAGRMIRRGLVKRCPLCGSGGLFRRWLFMVERCPRCGHRFNRRPEEGFFLGAYTINLAIVLVLLALTLFGYGLSEGGALGGEPWQWLVAALCIALVVPLITYPISKTVWSAIDLSMHPPEAVEQAEAINWLAGSAEGKGET